MCSVIRKRILRHSLIALLTFAFGVASTGIYRQLRPPFPLLDTYRGTTGSGVEIWSQTYGSPSGKNVIFMRLAFPSEGAARQSVENSLKGAEVIQRTSALDQEMGGERMFIRHVFPGMQVPIYTLIFLEGSKEVVIRGAVGGEVLAVEELLKSDGAI